MKIKIVNETLSYPTYEYTIAVYTEFKASFNSIQGVCESKMMFKALFNLCIVIQH